MTKKILLATLEYPPMIGGVGEYYRGLVDASEDRITVLAGSEKLLWKFWPRWLPMLWRIPREMKKTGATVVFAGEVLPVGTTLWILSLLSLPLYLLTSFPRLRYGVFVHGLDMALTGRKRWLATRILKRAKWVVANSENTKKIALGYGLDASKVSVLLPCPSTALTLALSTTPLLRAIEGRGEGVRLLSVARFVERKGYDTALAVLKVLRDRGLDVEWTFVGDGPDKCRIETLAQTLGVYDHVRWVASQRGEALAQEYESAQLFVFLPRQLANGDVEGFGMVCLEAALYGLPVVASDSGGVSEAVMNGVTGMITSSTDVERIANDIMKVLENSSMRQQMVRVARERVIKEFRWEQRASQLIKLVTV